MNIFVKKHIVTVEEGYLKTFLNVLGKFGLKFYAGDAYLEADPEDEKRKIQYCKVAIWATKRQMDDVYDMINVMANYRLR